MRNFYYSFILIVFLIRLVTIEGFLSFSTNLIFLTVLENIGVKLGKKFNFA